MSGKENGDNCVVEDSVGSVVFGSLSEIIVKSSYSFWSFPDQEPTYPAIPGLLLCY